jgi:hypothetical protein
MLGGDVPPRSIKETEQHFRTALMMGVIRTTEMSFNLHQITWCNISEDSHLLTCHLENLKSHLVKITETKYFALNVIFKIKTVSTPIILTSHFVIHSLGGTSKNILYFSNYSTPV